MVWAKGGVCSWNRGRDKQFGVWLQVNGAGMLQMLTSSLWHSSQYNVWSNLAQHIILQEETVNSEYIYISEVNRRLLTVCMFQ